MNQRYIKQIGDKWYDVHVVFDETGIGQVVDVYVTDDPPVIEDERELVYSTH